MTYRIKPLVWRFKNGIWKASAPGITYQLVQREDNKWLLSATEGKLLCRPVIVESVTTGRRLAWEDWEARILPALEEVPDSDSEAREMLSDARHAIRQIVRLKAQDFETAMPNGIRPAIREAIAEAERGQE